MGKRKPVWKELFEKKLLLKQDRRKLATAQKKLDDGAREGFSARRKTDFLRGEESTSLPVSCQDFIWKVAGNKAQP